VHSTLGDLGKQSSNQFFAMHLPPDEIVARVGVKLSVQVLPEGESDRRRLSLKLFGESR
jgi:hypothetical protein